MKAQNVYECQNTPIFLTFFSKYLVEWKIVSTFALAFEKYTFSKQLKKEFFERFYINRQVVQEAVLDYALLYGSYEGTG